MKKEIFYRVHYIVSNRYSKLYKIKGFAANECRRNPSNCKLVTYELKEINRDK